MSKRPRKRPRPHRVNPTDNRYSNSVRATGYPRGTGVLGHKGVQTPSGFKFTEPSIPENERVWRDVQSLGSGTMATLTGKKRYDELDAEQEAFANYVQFSFMKFDNWRQAWRLYQQEKVPWGKLSPSTRWLNADYSPYKVGKTLQWQDDGRQGIITYVAGQEGVRVKDPHTGEVKLWNRSMLELIPHRIIDEPFPHVA